MTGKDVLLKSIVFSFSPRANSMNGYKLRIFLNVNQMIDMCPFELVSNVVSVK